MFNYAYLLSSFYESYITLFYISLELDKNILLLLIKMWPALEVKLILLFISLNRGYQRLGKQNKLIVC